PPASSYPVFRPSLLASRTRFLRPPASVYDVSRYERAICLVETRRNHEHGDQKNGLSVADCAGRGAVRVGPGCVCGLTSRCTSKSQTRCQRLARSILRDLQG